MQERFLQSRQTADIRWAQLHLFEEIQFPILESLNQLSLMVLDLLQVVVMAGDQYLHHISVCQQLQTESGKATRDNYD